MNRTMKIAVALIVAAGISTMVYALPEQRAMAHPDPSDSDTDVIPFGANSPFSNSDPPAVGPNSADPSPKGTGHITYYTIQPGHDGWNLIHTYPPAWIGPSTNGVSINTINGTDLTAITNTSIVIAQIQNSHFIYSEMPYTSSNYAMCNVWDVFTHGFHMYCNTDQMQLPSNHQPELRVAVLNP